MLCTLYPSNDEIKNLEYPAGFFVLVNERTEAGQDKPNDEYVILFRMEVYGCPTGLRRQILD